MDNMKNKVAIITGSGKGIGRAIAITLASAGARVVVSSRTQTDIDAVVREINALGGNAIAVKADVSSESSVKRLIEITTHSFGGIDILVNNAGIGTFSNVAAMKTEDFDRMWNVNMRGVFLCTREALPSMIQQTSGDIINIASLAGRNAFIGGAGYAATKWALIGFSRCLMLEVRDKNIRVITICPGSVDTGFVGPSANVKHSPQIPKAEDLAQVVLDALQMPRHVMMSEIDVRPTNPNLAG